MSFPRFIAAQRIAPRAALVVAVALFGSVPDARAAWAPAGIDLTRPRILFRAGEEATFRDRLTREPYVSIAVRMASRAAAAGGLALDDHSINAERIKARAARSLAFLYAIDRKVVSGQVLPFDSAAERAAMGDRVRDLLVSMYTRSRLAVPPPLGGWDRDISSSEELLGYATAYDTLVGAGYDLGADGPVVVENIASLASELYDNFENPDTAGGYTRLHQNNHRSKSASAIAIAAIAIAEYTPAAGTDPRGVRDPAIWIEFGLEQTDLVMRHTLVTEDGAYGEGPFYLRYASQNVFPFARAWDRLVGGAAWTARGVEVPSLWSHPLLARTQRWMLDLTLPDGSLAPIDDGNPGRSHFFGQGPPPADPALAAAYAWRWANAPQPFDADGNVDLGPDAIVTYDDSIAPAPPVGPTTAFYFEGGNAVFRSDWTTDAVVAMVNAEHDTASEFGRDRAGLGTAPQSHEHAEPGAFLLHAFGERLALDPGYLSFSLHSLVNKPEHHNVILVDGKGPIDPLGASIDWLNDPAGPAPTDGQAFLSDALDTAFLDAARVRTRYGRTFATGADIERRFLFADERYLVAVDTASVPGPPPAAFTWLLHGNGGGNGVGAFAQTPAGGRWTRGGARLDSAIAFDTGPPAFTVGTSVHEEPGNDQRTHAVLRAGATGAVVRSAQIVYPTRSTEPAPEASAVEVPGAAAVVLADAAGDRRVLVVHRAAATETPVTIPGAASGLSDATADGSIALFDAHLDGSLRLAWAERATEIGYRGTTHLRVERPGGLGLRLSPGRADVVVENRDPTVAVHGLEFTPLAADGACDLDTSGDAPVVRLGLERRFALRAGAGNSAPAADPGRDRWVPLGSEVHLDSGASCDLDGEALSSRWELVSAPPAADWVLHGAGTPTPWFSAGASGSYRLRLTVTDARGAVSLPRDLVVTTFGPGEDRDGDLVPDAADDCPDVPDPEQIDDHPRGGNGRGDACECTDGACASGGGPATVDCALELRGLEAELVDPSRIACRDGAPCDHDPGPGRCAVDLLLCVGSRDPSLPSCTAFDVAEIQVRQWAPDGRQAIAGPLARLPGTTDTGRGRVTFSPAVHGTEVCTAPFRLSVPAPSRQLRVTAIGTNRRTKDVDRFRVVCER